MQTDEETEPPRADDINDMPFTTPLSAQTAEWLVHKDLCNNGTAWNTRKQECTNWSVAGSKRRLGLVTTFASTSLVTVGAATGGPALRVRVAGESSPDWLSTTLCSAGARPRRQARIRPGDSGGRRGPGAQCED